MLVGTRAHAAAVGEDDLGGDEVVDRHPVAAALVGDTAAERQARDTRLRHDAARRGQSQRRGCAVDVGPGRAALHMDGAAGVIDAHGAHRGEVDDDAVVDRRRARDVVPAAANGQGEPALGREAHGGRDVVGVGAACDERRPPVDHPVPDSPRGVVFGVVGRDYPAGQVLGEGGRWIDGE